MENLLGWSLVEVEESGEAEDGSEDTETEEKIEWHKEEERQH